MRFDETEAINIKRILLNLLSKIWVALLIALIAGSISNQKTTPTYSSSALMFVRFENNSSVKETTINMITSYTMVLKGDEAMQEVADSIVETVDAEHLKNVFSLNDGKLSPSQVKGKLSVYNSKEDEMVIISSTTYDPEVSAALCNALADIAPKYVAKLSPSGKAEIINRAVPNYSSNVSSGSEKRMRIAFVAVCALILFFDLITHTVKDPRELSRIYSLPVIGELKTRNILGKNNSTLVNRDDVKPHYAESYKTIRTELKSSLDKSGKKAIAVSGVGNMDRRGSHFIVAANIAISFAQTGKRVLLVDADLRNPSDYSECSVQGDKGLTTLLAGDSDTDGAVKRGIAENLDLLPSGPLPANPSELLSSDGFAALLHQLTDGYDYVILNTPYLNEVGDALIAGNLAGSIVLTVRYNSTRYPDITKTVKMINAMDIAIPGFIVDGIMNFGNIPIPGLSTNY